MPYVMETHDAAYTSVSGLGEPPANAAAIKAAVKKLQSLVGTSPDGKWGSNTQKKFLEWLKKNGPAVLASFPEKSLSPSNPLVAGLLVSKGGMSGADVLLANSGWACWINPNASGCARSAASLPSVPGTPDVPIDWASGGPVVEEEASFFDKYWWLIAIGALGVGGVVFWKMKQKKA